MGRYIRFVIGKQNKNTEQEEGLFRSAYALQRSIEISATDKKNLDDLIGWFEKNLKSPDRLNRSKSKGYRRRTTKGVSWFKPEAVEHIDRMRSIAAVLEAYDHLTSQISTEKPGYVVYEDNHQIVAEPFRD
jgi:hypothetical protein